MGAIPLGIKSRLFVNQGVDYAGHQSTAFNILKGHKSLQGGTWVAETRFFWVVANKFRSSPQSNPPSFPLILALSKMLKQWTSIPHVSFVVRHGIFLQQAPVFVLKRLLAMMLFLVCDVILEHRHVRRTYRKGAIAGLPIERMQMGRLFFHRFGRFALQFAHENGDRFLAAKRTEDVRVIFNSADDQGGRAACLAGSGEVGVAVGAESFVDKERLSSFGGEDEVKIDLGERLRHGGDPGDCRRRILETQAVEFARGFSCAETCCATSLG